MTATIQSLLVVRRSIHILASPARVWEEFTTYDRMNRWWGVVIGNPEAGSGKGQRLLTYEPHVGGRIEMEVIFDGVPWRYGGMIKVFAPGKELTFENDWIPNRGWLKPTYVTLRLTPALGGTHVELMHHGFENTGPDAGREHSGYESGWTTLQLTTLREVIEGK